MTWKSPETYWINRAKKAEAEIVELNGKLKEWREKAKNWMASDEAAKRLEGYRDLGSRVEKAEAEAERLRNKIATMENKKG
jgi:predicted  nucleic acid-binding Zn-ribbon protein